MKDFSNSNEQTNSNNLKTIHYIMFGMEGLIASILIIYLIMSKFNKLTIKETLKGKNSILIFILLTIIITALLMILQIEIANKLFVTESTNFPNNQPTIPNQSMNEQSSSVTKTGAMQIDGTDETLTASYTFY